MHFVSWWLQILGSCSQWCTWWICLCSLSSGGWYTSLWNWRHPEDLINCQSSIQGDRVQWCWLQPPTGPWVCHLHVSRIQSCLWAFLHFSCISCHLLRAWVEAWWSRERPVSLYHHCACFPLYLVVVDFVTLLVRIFGEEHSGSTHLTTVWCICRAWEHSCHIQRDWLWNIFIFTECHYFWKPQ